MACLKWPIREQRAAGGSKALLARHSFGGDSSNAPPLLYRGFLTVIRSQQTLPTFATDSSHDAACSITGQGPTCIYSFTVKSDHIACAYQWIQIRFPNIPTIRRVGISLSIFEPSVHAHGLTLYRAVKRKLQDNRSEKVVAEFVPQL